MSQGDDVHAFVNMLDPCSFLYRIALMLKMEQQQVMDKPGSAEQDVHLGYRCMPQLKFLWNRTMHVGLTLRVQMNTSVLSRCRHSHLL